MAEDKRGLKQKATDALDRIRAKVPVIDHVVRMHQHYGAIKGNMQAGGVTYFGFLSFFPILALAFFVIGYVAKVYPDAQADLVEAIDQVLPGMIGDGKGQMKLSSIQSAASAVGLIGLAGLLYAGLGWLSAMRDALLVVFERPEHEQPNFIFGKLRDLLTLAIIGVTLILSVAVSGMVTGFSRQLLDWLGLGSELRPALALVGLCVGLMANMVLFFALFKLLAQPKATSRALWMGTFLGAIGFEALKWLSSFLIASVKGQPAFTVFGIALILLVWINYFSRVVMYAAAWAHTAETSAVAPGRRKAS